MLSFSWVKKVTVPKSTTYVQSFRFQGGSYKWRNKQILFEINLTTGGENYMELVALNLSKAWNAVQNVGDWNV